MIKEFSTHIIDTLVKAMGAVDKDGQADYKSRLEATKQAVQFFESVTSGLSRNQREDLSASISNSMVEKLEKAKLEEEQYKEILNERKRKRTHASDSEPCNKQDK